MAAVEYRTTESEDTVHRASEPRTDRLHAPGESAPALRFDEQVHVVALQGVVQNAKVAALARNHALAEASSLI